MKHLKKFELFDFSQTIPVIPADELLKYYSCDDCGRIWRDTKENTVCKDCKSNHIEELSDDEWYALAKRAKNIGSVEDLDKEREDISRNMYDLKTLKNNRINVN